MAWAISSAGTRPLAASAVEHTVARVARRIRRAIRPPRLGRLRQRHQQRGFAERKAARLLAEPGQRSGTNPFDIAAIGRKVKVKGEDLVLAERALELDRAHDLAQLGGEVALARGSSRRATCMVSVEPPDTMRPFVASWPGGARQRQRVDPVMGAEAPVLVGKQEVEQARVDIGRGHGQAPAAFQGRIGPQQPPFAVEHHGGVFQVPSIRHRTERRDEGDRRRRCDRRDERGGRERDIGGVGSLRASTSRVPVPVRPKRSGRYMSST